MEVNIVLTEKINRIATINLEDYVKDAKDPLQVHEFLKRIEEDPNDFFQNGNLSMIEIERFHESLTIDRSED